MWIITIDGERHSAWNSRNQAYNQVNVLDDHGYKKIKVVYDETVSCENGHYFM